MTARPASELPARPRAGRLTRAVTSRGRLAFAAAAWLALTVLAGLLLDGGNLNYDLAWALEWGRTAADGGIPDYELRGATTPHPLTNLVSAAVVTVSEDGAADVFRWISYGAYAGLVVIVALVSAELVAWPAGIVAGATLAVSAPMAETTAVAFQDVAAAALVLLALWLEILKPRRGSAPLVALTLAGLLRPEAWGLAAAYWLYVLPGRSPGERARLAVLAAAAPAIWILSDWAITGEPLYSFTGTREGAEVAQRETGVFNGPRLLVEHLRATVEKVVLVGGSAGAVGALVLLRLRRRDVALARAADPRLLVVVALGALMALAFLTLAVGELSLLERYVFVLAAVLAVTFGFFTMGWLRAPPGALRWLWAVGGIASVAAFGYIAPRQVDRTELSMPFIRDDGDVVDSLQSLATQPEARRVLDRCGRVVGATYRVRPYLSYALSRAPGSVVIYDGPRSFPARGALVFPTTRESDLFARPGGAVPLLPVPRDLRVAASVPGWRVLARGC